MVILLALFGALIIGLVVGLTWRGFVIFGDRRQLEILTEELDVQHRMNLATNSAIASMRRIALEHLRADDS